MAPAHRWTVMLTNDNVNELNYAEFGIETDVNAGVAGSTAAAQIIAYTALVAGLVCADGTRLAGLKLRDGALETSIDYPFPVSQYAAIKTANDAEYPGLVTMAAYGVEIGITGAGLNPLGTSVVMTEYTATGGPSGRGRHFLPFIAGTTVTAGGYLDPDIRTNLELVYNNFIRELNITPGASGLVTLEPVVENSAHTTIKAITSVKAQPVFSNLKSRRR